MKKTIISIFAFALVLCSSFESNQAGSGFGTGFLTGAVVSGVAVPAIVSASQPRETVVVQQPAQPVYAQPYPQDVSIKRKRSREYLRLKQRNEELEDQLDELRAEIRELKKQKQSN